MPVSSSAARRYSIRCWDAGYEGLSNLVNVHVGRIRKKLEAAGGPPLLHTVRGAGFKVDARR